MVTPWTTVRISIGLLQSPAIPTPAPLSTLSNPPPSAAEDGGIEPRTSSNGTRTGGYRHSSQSCNRGLTHHFSQVS